MSRFNERHPSYKDLLKVLKGFTDEQLEMSVSVYDEVKDTPYSLADCITAEEMKKDVLEDMVAIFDENQPFLVFNRRQHDFNAIFNERRYKKTYDAAIQMQLDVTVQVVGLSFDLNNEDTYNENHEAELTSSIQDAIKREDFKIDGNVRVVQLKLANNLDSPYAALVFTI
jgi:hypothetical protein